MMGRNANDFEFNENQTTKPQYVMEVIKSRICYPATIMIPQTRTQTIRRKRKNDSIMTTKNLTLLLALTAATISAGPHQVAAFAPAPSRIQARASISNNNIKQFTVQETLLSAQQQPTNDDDNENGNPVHTSLEQQTDNFEDSMESTRKSTDPASAIEKTFSNVFKSAKTNQAALAAVTMLALAQPLPSNAAMSGGRMGGSFSSPAPRMSTTPRSSGGYSRGYGGGGGYGRGYSSGYATGLGAGYLTAPRIGYSPFAPAIYAPRPYYGGGGIISYSGPNLGQLVFFGGLAFAVSSALKKESPDWSSPLERADGTTSVLGPGNSVIKVSVALEVPNRDDPGSIISVLNRLGQTANTDTRKGVQSLTSQGECSISQKSNILKI
jgi:hypothetical protein